MTFFSIFSISLKMNFLYFFKDSYFKAKENKF